VCLTSEYTLKFKSVHAAAMSGKKRVNRFRSSISSHLGPGILFKEEKGWFELNVCRKVRNVIDKTNLMILETSSLRWNSVALYTRNAKPMRKLTICTVMQQHDIEMMTSGYPGI
jgi:hypothetical protein